MNDLEVIAPLATFVTFQGRQLQVAPLKVGQLPAFARAIKPISGTIEALASGRAALDLPTILTAIADHGDAVIEAVAIGSGVSQDELREATPDQLIELAIGVVRINADFFKGRLTPAILAAMKAATPGAGPTP